MNTTIPSLHHLTDAQVLQEVQRLATAERCATAALVRAAERGFLEFHHVVPFAVGGVANSTNIELRCRAHNALEAQLFFGGEVTTEPVERGT